MTKLYRGRTSASSSASLRDATSSLGLSGTGPAGSTSNPPVPPLARVPPGDPPGENVRQPRTGLQPQIVVHLGAPEVGVDQQDAVSRSDSASARLQAGGLALAHQRAGHHDHPVLVALVEELQVGAKLGRLPRGDPSCSSEVSGRMGTSRS